MIIKWLLWHRVWHCGATKRNGRKRNWFASWSQCVSWTGFIIIIRSTFCVCTKYHSLINQCFVLGNSFQRRWTGCYEWNWDHCKCWPKLEIFYSLCHRFWQGDHGRKFEKPKTLANWKKNIQKSWGTPTSEPMFNTKIIMLTFSQKHLFFRLVRRLKPLRRSLLNWWKNNELPAKQH